MLLAAHDYYFHGISFFEFYEKFVTPVELLGLNLPFFVWLIVLFYVSSPIDSTYWYYRERNPKYIRKMEEIERVRQAKEARQEDQMGQGGSE